MADSGYSYELLITPDPNKSKAWNDMQKGMCSIVEMSIRMVKLYTFAAERVQVAPEIHELGILTCYKLTNLRFKVFPLRPARPTTLLLED